MQSPLLSAPPISEPGSGGELAYPADPGDRHLGPRPLAPATSSPPSTAGMASLKLRAAASNSSDLPLDSLSEILLRLEAKELCRIRAVSPTWRSLTYDRGFIAAHRARHPEPLLAFAHSGENKAHSIDIVDLSGKLVRRIPRELSSPSPPSDRRPPPRTDLLPSHLDLLCVRCRYRPMALWVLNPATGAALALPECHSEDLELEISPQNPFWNSNNQVDRYAFGQVSTGEYKALRITRFSKPCRMLCEVITIDAGGSSHGMWRKTHGPPALICAGNGMSFGHMEDDMKCVVVGGVVHFVVEFRFIYNNLTEMAVEPGSIASFNLETEEWMPILHGPAPIHTLVQDSIREYSYVSLDIQLSLCDLNGCLVTVHHTPNTSMDLWFLSDFEKGLWVKKYSMPPAIANLVVFPLLVLDDGRMVFRSGINSIDCYDLKTGAYTSVVKFETGANSRSIGIYTGSLLTY